MPKKNNKKKATPDVRTPTSHNHDAWFPPPWIHSSYLDLQAQKLEDLHERSVEWGQEATKDLGTQLEQFRGRKQSSDIEDWLIDDAYAIKEQLRWSHLLQFVGLYHLLEHAIGGVFKWRFSGHPKETKLLRQIHKWDELGVLLEDHCGVSAKGLRRYDEVDDLRLLCNAVKHTGGLISKELASKRAGWKVDDPIPHETVDLVAMRRATVDFLQDLVAQAETGVTKLIGPPPGGTLGPVQKWLWPHLV